MSTYVYSSTCTGREDEGVQLIIQHGHEGREPLLALMSYDEDWGLLRHLCVFRSRHLLRGSVTKVKLESRGRRSGEAAEEVTSGCSQGMKVRIAEEREGTCHHAQLDLVMAPLRTSVLQFPPAALVAWELRNWTVGQRSY